MNNTKQDIQEKIGSRFKDLCQNKLKKQPNQNLVNCLRPNGLLHLEIEALSTDDADFLQILFCMPVTHIHIEGTYLKPPKTQRSLSKKSVAVTGSSYFSTPAGPENPTLFKFMLRYLNKVIQHSLKLKSLTLQYLPLTERNFLQLRSGIQNSRYLKELAIKHCGITEKHIQPLIACMISNKSLMSIDFSNNRIANIGQIIGKVLSQHSTRRDEQMWLYGLRNQLPQQDISTFGICEVNIDNNLIDDKSISEFMKFFRADNWTRALSLRGNSLSRASVQEFALLMKKNTSLISLDLRDNPGFEKQFSKPIFKKLVKNITQFKKYKENYGKKEKEETSTNQPRQISNYHTNTSQTQNNVSQATHHQQRNHNHRSNSKKKRSTTTHHNSYVVENKSPATRPSKLAPHMNTTQQLVQPLQGQIKCQNCRLSHIHLLQVEKRNLDLMLENNRLKKLLYPKNFDLSAINPPSLQTINNNMRQQLQASVGFNNNEQSQDVLQKIQNLMMDLTKILENIEHQTQTQILHPLSTTNNMSNTVHNMSNTVHILATSQNQHSYFDHRREEDDSTPVDHYS